MRVWCRMKKFFFKERKGSIAGPYPCLTPAHPIPEHLAIHDFMESSRWTVDGFGLGDRFWLGVWLGYHFTCAPARAQLGLEMCSSLFLVCQPTFCSLGSAWKGHCRQLCAVEYEGDFWSYNSPSFPIFFPRPQATLPQQQRLINSNRPYATGLFLTWHKVPSPPNSPFRK